MSEQQPMFLVWSNEHGGWWKPGGYGYTLDYREAGRFTHTAAVGIVDTAAQGGPYDRGVDVLPEVMTLAPEWRWQGGPPDPYDLSWMEARCRRCGETMPTGDALAHANAADCLPVEALY